MISYKDELNKQLEELRQLEKKAANREKTYKGLEKGSIRVSKSRGHFQYHFRKEGEEKEQYISKIDISRIRLLVQREYDEKVHNLLKDMINRLEKFNGKYDADSIDDLYENLRDGRREFVTPIRPTREMIINNWYATHKGNQNSYERKYEFPTLRGELVRSKSEKILADYFYNKGIPYVCEPEIRLKSGKHVYPDFGILNVRLNKTMYWEHLGLIEQEGYASRNFEKILDYEECGLILGKNLIITLETQERPLDVKVVDEKARVFLT